MAISLSSLRRSGESRPPRILTHAVHGIGKTSLAAGMPSPVFLQTEDGLGMIDAPTFGMLRTYEQVLEAIGALYSEPHEFQTVVVDSVDWLEPIVWAETCRANNWPNIEHPGYGKGYAAALDTWRVILDGFNTLRDERGMAIMLIAHTAPVRFDSPESEAYDRYQPKLQKGASALLQEHVDCVWFLNYRVSILKENKKDLASRARGVGGGGRVLYTTERPSHLAKNRYRMPDSIPLPDDPDAMWPQVAASIPFYATTTNQKAA
jgi:hypothetical protein